MSTRDSQAARRLERPEVWGGTALAAVAVVAWVCAWDLPVGALHQPGPGLFPKGLAVIVGLLALGILGRGLAAPEGSVRSLWPERSGRQRVGAMLAYLMRKFKFEAAPLVLALILGKPMEESLRQALGISQGSFAIFVERPISLALLLATAGSLATPVLRWAWRRRAARPPFVGI